MPILEILIKIILSLKTPDDSQEFFPENNLNKAAYQLYKSDPGKYVENMVLLNQGDQK